MVDTNGKGFGLRDWMHEKNSLLMAQCTAPRKMLVGGVDVELVGNPKRKV